MLVQEKRDSGSENSTLNKIDESNADLQVHVQI
jgi:hypothetical protein